jgi:hypothetical protein
MIIERNKMPKGWRAFTLLLYGMPKVGKSTLAAAFSPDGIEGSLIIDTEDGTDEIECNRVKVKSLEALNQALNIAFKSEFSTIVIDTIDEVYHMAEVQTVFKLNAKMGVIHSSVEEFAYGVGYAVARNTVMDIINRLHIFKSVGKNVLIISHQKQATSDSDSEKSRTVDLPGKLSRMIAASMDAIGLVYTKKDQSENLHRYISFKPYDQIDAGCRLKELAGKDIKFSFEAIHNEFAKAEKPKRKQTRKAA